MIKVLVVDDSAFMRKVLSDFIDTSLNMEVKATARNGEDALKKLSQERFDVITLDIEMPVLDGLATLQAIMEHDRIPTIMVSSTTALGTENTIKALSLGAVDVVRKPGGAISLSMEEVKEELLQKIETAASINLNKLEKRPARKRSAAPLSFEPDGKKLVLIGTSTGGPKALQQVLTDLPRDFSVPVLIVQHMPPKFTKSLAARLNSLTSLTVKEGEDGEIVQNRTIYIAPGGSHMEVKMTGRSVTIQLSDAPPIKGHRPSVDSLFLSAYQLEDYAAVAVILTGMGDDGSNGLHYLKQAGNCYAIAEDESTSIVYGMPKAAEAACELDAVVSLPDVAAEIVAATNQTVDGMN
ncbi:protein-glutamate methylesterase/protein-glutamine glutaminase [Salsuginibacillus kocurii]|uniref:protein-glutamate methylesterase/protein-glutamine glutaminase n=1 Tax=Salsuginibacillus kocurii TaxID=427078 RepID=UPI000377E7A7|nr:chemotaxis response regulator protein-glutamate methylesterase [Salsuginibacillus kocurii]